MMHPIVLVVIVAIISPSVYGQLQLQMQVPAGTTVSPPINICQRPGLDLQPVGACVLSWIGNSILNGSISVLNATGSVLSSRDLGVSPANQTYYRLGNGTTLSLQLTTSVASTTSNCSLVFTTADGLASYRLYFLVVAGTIGLSRFTFFVIYT